MRTMSFVSGMHFCWWQDALPATANKKRDAKKHNCTYFANILVYTIILESTNILYEQIYFMNKYILCINILEYTNILYEQIYLYIQICLYMQIYVSVYTFSMACKTSCREEMWSRATKLAWMLRQRVRVVVWRATRSSRSRPTGGKSGLKINKE